MQKILEVKGVQHWGVEIKNILTSYNEFVYANKFENLGKVDHYLKSQSLKLIVEKTESLNSSVIILEIRSLLKNLRPNKQCSGAWRLPHLGSKPLRWSISDETWMVRSEPCKDLENSISNLRNIKCRVSKTVGEKQQKGRNRLKGLT